MSHTSSLAPAAPAPDLPPLPGETPRAFGAFLTFYQLGQARSLAGTAQALGEKRATVKAWSSRHRWPERLRACQSGRLAAHLASERRQTADWARRRQEFREQRWAAGQKLLHAAACFLDSFGDRELQQITLAQVARAIQIGTRITTDALSGGQLPEEQALSSSESELMAALQKAYGTPAPRPAPPAALSDPRPSTPGL